MSSLDEDYMRVALSLGRRGLGRVWPNPAVGCVLVNHGRIVGRGWTQPSGRPHAETIALAQAGALANGATAYVTLEPCAHHGKTPPCADALIAAGVRRVAAAMEDSDPRVSGKGFAALRAAGIEVVTGVCADQAAQDHAGFFLRTEAGRPWVTLKLAFSLDGRIATKSGDSQWITGPDARRAVHAMRARHDAVLIGAGTARADDPSLTVRGLGINHQPVRIVAARSLDIPADGILACSAHDVPVWLCHSSDAAGPERMENWRGLGVKLLDIKENDAGLEPQAMLQSLASEGLTRIFCEGGGHLAATLLQADLVDELVIHTAGVAIGGDGLSGIAPMGHEILAKASRMSVVSMRRIGPDIEHVWRRT